MSGRKDGAEDVQIASGEIPEGAIAMLGELVEKYNRKAAKLNKPPIEMDVGKAYPKVFKVNTPDDYVRKITLMVSHVSMSGQIPYIKGWEMVGKLDYEEDSTGHHPIMASAPGRELPKDLRDCASTRCDHCKKNIPRNALYVLRNKEDDEDDLKVVGGSCLKDFATGVGEKDIEWLVSSHEHIERIIGTVMDGMDPDSPLFGESMRRQPPVMRLDDFLYYCALHIGDNGYVSRTRAMENEDLESTASAVFGDIAYSLRTPEIIKRYGSRRCPKSEFAAKARAAEEKVAQVVTWLGEVDDSRANDFMHNLKLIFDRGVVSPKTSGYAASMISAYDRQAEKERVRRERPQSEHVQDQSTEAEKRKMPKTAIGRLKDFEAAVLAVRVFDGDFGAQTRYTLCQRGTGNILHCYTGRPPSIDDGQGAREPEKGDVIRFNALIKKHDVLKGGHYEGSKVTYIKQLSKVAYVGKEDELDASKSAASVQLTKEAEAQADDGGPAF